LQEYKEVFEPLLLEECCAQMLRGVEEGEVLTPHPCAVAAHETVSVHAGSYRWWGCHRGRDGLELMLRTHAFICKVRNWVWLLARKHALMLYFELYTQESIIDFNPA